MYLHRVSLQKERLEGDLETHEIFVSRDVIFHEHSFPFTPTDDSATTQALDEACVTARNSVFDTLGPYEEAQGKTSSMMQPIGDSFPGPISASPDHAPVVYDLTVGQVESGGVNDTTGPDVRGNSPRP